MWVKRKEYEAVLRRLEEAVKEREHVVGQLADLHRSIGAAGMYTMGGKVVPVRSMGDVDHERMLARAVEEQRLVIHRTVELLADVETPDEALEAAHAAMKLVSDARKRWETV